MRMVLLLVLAVCTTVVDKCVIVEFDLRSPLLT